MTRRTTVKKTKPKKAKAVPSKEDIKETVIATVKPKRTSKPRASTVKPVEPQAVELAPKLNEPLPVVARTIKVDVHNGDTSYTETLYLDEPTSHRSFGTETDRRTTAFTEKVAEWIAGMLPILPNITSKATEACSSIVDYDFDQLKNRRAWFQFWKPDLKKEFELWLEPVINADASDDLVQLAQSSVRQLQREAFNVGYPIREFNRLVGMYKMFEELETALIDAIENHQAIPNAEGLSIHRENVSAIVNSFSMLQQDDWNSRYNLIYTRYTTCIADLREALSQYGSELINLKNGLSNEILLDVLIDTVSGLRARVKEQMTFLNATRIELLNVYLSLSRSLTCWAETRPTLT